MKHRTQYNGLRVLFGLAIGLLLIACAGPEERPAAPPAPSGFLSDYSLLQPGGEDRALLLYLNPNADFSAYDKVLLKRAKVWFTKGATKPEASMMELSRLAELFTTEVDLKLREDYEMVYEPGPGVMQIRLALTQAQESVVAIDLAPGAIPHSPLISASTRLATGTRDFVGQAGVEGEITDSQTGEILVAAVDRRAGGKSLASWTYSWSDVEKSFGFWANRLIQRLREWRGATQHAP